MKGLLVVFSLVCGSSAVAMECVVKEKCGKSGMCVAAADAFRVEPGDDGYRINGLPASQSPEAFRLDPQGAFVWKPDPKDTHAPGAKIDQMAVRFSGHCEIPDVPDGQGG